MQKLPQSPKKTEAPENEAVTLLIHEMRTGLTSASWTLQLILEKYENELTPEDRDIIQGVIDSVHTSVMHSIKDTK